MPAGYSVLDQSVPVLPISLRKQENNPNEGVDLLAENRHHLPRNCTHRRHGPPVVGRSRPHLTAECLDVVHADCGLTPSKQILCVVNELGLLWERTTSLV
jgi:hypothetical protein